jgi:hypothetical protein
MRHILSLIASIALFSCNNTADKKGETTETPAPPVADLVFDKLTGVWQTEDGKSFERWTKHDTGYQTTGFSVKGADTVWNEQGKVFKENDSWVFENTVNGQNDGKAVRFTATIIDANTVQFSNPTHDFPTDINYTVADTRTLRAFIVGPNSKGGKDTIPFNFTRAK